MTYLNLDAFNRLNNSDYSLGAQPFLRYHLIKNPGGVDLDTDPKTRNTGFGSDHG